MSPTNIAVFYHVAHLGPWEAVDREILDAVADSGLLARANVFVRNDCRDTNLFEFPTIELLRAFAQSHDDYAICYLHTKGVTRPIPSVDDWRKMMLYWVVTRWEECLGKLQQGYDAVGPCVIDTPIRHFQGNFWWATSGHVRHLPRPRDISYRPTYDNQTERHKCEFWVLSRPAKVYQPYHHRLDPYQHRNPPERYVGSAF